MNTLLGCEIRLKLVEVFIINFVFCPLSLPLSLIILTLECWHGNAAKCGRGALSSTALRSLSPIYLGFGVSVAAHESVFS